MSLCDDTTTTAAAGPRLPATSLKVKSFLDLRVGPSTKIGWVTFAPSPVWALRAPHGPAHGRFAPVSNAKRPYVAHHTRSCAHYRRMLCTLYVAHHTRSCAHYRRMLCTLRVPTSKRDASSARALRAAYGRFAPRTSASRMFVTGASRPYVARSTHVRAPIIVVERCVRCACRRQSATVGRSRTWRVEPIIGRIATCRAPRACPRRRPTRRRPRHRHRPPSSRRRRRGGAGRPRRRARGGACRAHEWRARCASRGPRTASKP